MRQAKVRKPVTTTVRIPAELMEWVKRYAKEADISQNTVFIAALAELRTKVDRWERRKGELWIPPVILR